MKDIISEFHKDPFMQLQMWLQLAESKNVTWPDEMALATIGLDGHPKLRTVLFKGFLEQQISFYTNYNSDKGREIARNPQVSLLFFWQKPLDYQVRIEGVAEKTTFEQSERYFHSRHRESQISAWASPQSEEMKDRALLEERGEEIRKRYEGKEIPCPPHWGGYVVRPTAYDFMILDSHRLHDRFQYRLVNGQWQIHRVAP